jgi:hypothetical protein
MMVKNHFVEQSTLPDPSVITATLLGFGVVGIVWVGGGGALCLWFFYFGDRVSK